MNARAACALTALGAVLLLSACALLERSGTPSGQSGPAKEGAAASATRPGTEATQLQPEGLSVTANRGELAQTQPLSAPGIYPGTGVFIKPPPPPAPPVEVTPVGDVTLNFADADIREVARSILGDILKVNYLIDPAVQGTITVQTSRPLPRSALLATLEKILRLAGAALIGSDHVYEIVPLEKAPRETARLEVGTERARREPGFSIRVVPLEFASAAEMQKILEPLLPAGGILRVDEARNLLILGGTRRELDAWLETVEVFDVDWLKGMSFGVFPLQFTDPKTLAEELKTILTQDPSSPLAGVLRFVPIERLNALLVISPRPAYVEQAQSWVERLDRGGDGTERRLYVYYVQNGRAANLAAVLSEIFIPEAAPGRPPEARLAPGLQPVEIRPVTGTETAQGPEAGAAAQPEGALTRAPVAPEAGEVFTLRGEGQIRIIPDEATNALVILARPADYRMIKAALEKLDIVPLQVLIEATIAEVTLTDELKYGLQWFFRAGESEFTLSEVATGAVAQIFPGFSYLLGGTDVRTALNALASVTDVKVISSPQVMVLDNQTSTLQVGDTVPVATQSAVSVIDPEAPIVNTIEFRDTGVILTVTPRVNAGGLVIMEIDQEVSDVVATTTSGIDSPTFQRRSITSTVAIQSGESVALGGLIRDSQSSTESGVPILSDIPILGALFRSTDAETKRTELLVLITPRVVGSLEEARAVTEELRGRLKTVVPLGRRIE